MIKPLRLAFCLAALSISQSAQAQTNPWFGTWKVRLKAPTEKPETLVYSDAGGGAMRMESVEAKSILVTHFDGKPASDIGEGGSRGQGGALAVKSTSPTSYTWTFFVGGKPWVQGVNRLAPNRKTFTEVSWLVTKPAAKITHIYERQ